mmetsp:Transcript_17968/g.21538  ORF Transcript_17968/g.21538 Transcript_17968/m.21538 type:complete len:159 (+) Transcript_17968:106-582(+)
MLWLKWSILYGESLMTVLHVWILVGLKLPPLALVAQQHILIKHSYLLSDLLLPILASMQNQFECPILIRTLIFVHTLLYAVFLLGTGRMNSTMEWAYSGWTERIILPVGPALAVILDTICHSWGMYILLQQDKLPRKMIPLSFGIAAGSVTIAALGRT